MKRVFVLALLACGLAVAVGAQTVDTTVCAVVKNPKPFDGKIVRIKGTVVAGFDSFIVKDSEPCGYQVDGIWLSYPQGTKAKAGPAAILQIQPARNFTGKYTPPQRATITLDKSKDFKQFDSLLSQTHNKGADLCLGCMRYTVTATLVGRLDTVPDAALQRDKDGKIVGFGGFGNLNAYPARLVLQSVADVTPKEIDYSKTDAITKGDVPMVGGPGELFDPMAMAEKAIQGLAGSPAGDTAKKDLAAFGKPTDHTGATFASGTTNEAAAKDEALGTKDSPDGVLFNCTFNSNRLEGTAQMIALIHMGQHISEMRAPMQATDTPPLFILEYNGWNMSAGAAVGIGQRFLTMPGGYLLWNRGWTPEERTPKMDDALKGFLANEAALSR
jgi:hypothetical protein